MTHIHVTFEFEGKQHSGQLSQVSGSGNSSTYFLSVDGFHWGQLSYVEGHPGFNGLHAVPAGWRFTSNVHPELSELAEYFGSIVISWVDSNS